MKRYAKREDIKVGTIGYGPSFWIARHHLQQMKATGMTVTAVADIDEKQCREAAAHFPGIQTFTSAAELLEKTDVDLLAICTPHNTHASLAIQCMEAGRHVVTEKPFAVSTEECDAMIEAARANDVMLSTYHNRHWDGWILGAVERIRGGMIGDVVRIEAHACHYGKPRDNWWRSCKPISGGILYDWGAHFLEYSLQLLDGNMTEIWGHRHDGFWAPHTMYGKDTNEDEAMAVVRFDSGQVLTLFMSAIDNKGRKGMLEVTGTRGTFIIDPDHWEATVREPGGLVQRRGPNPPSETWRFYDNVASHLVDGTELIITPEWARRPIHILDWAGKSAAAGKALPTLYP